MTREFCDRCGHEVTDIQSGSILGIEDGDAEGNGTVTNPYHHICEACYRAWLAFMKATPVSAAKQSRTRK
jgi:hypothetical protein